MSWLRIFGLGKRSQLPRATAPKGAVIPPQVAQLVEASGLPAEVRVALLEPALGLKVDAAPAAIATARTILDLAAAFHGEAMSPRSIGLTADLVRERASVDSARAKLLEQRAADDETIGEIVTTPPPSITSSHAGEIYGRRRLGR